MSLLAALALVVGIGAPSAPDQLRAGRAAFSELAVRREAEGALSRWYEEDWVTVAPALFPGEVRPFPNDSANAGTVIERQLVRVSPSVWMLEVRVVERDQAARDLAASRQALLVGVRSDPGDSVQIRYRIARPWVQAHQ
ncbi:MAG: hypothetical protein ACYC2K_17205 [Gemmatimonadales bacterium]